MPLLESAAASLPSDAELRAKLLLWLSLSRRASGATSQWEDELTLAESSFRSAGSEIAAAVCRLNLWRERLRGAEGSPSPSHARDDLLTVLELAESEGHGALAAGAALLLNLIQSREHPQRSTQAVEPLLRAWRILESIPRGDTDPIASSLGGAEWLLPDPGEVYRQLVAHFVQLADGGDGAPGGTWPDDTEAGRAAWIAFVFADRLHAWKERSLSNAGAFSPGPTQLEALREWERRIVVPCASGEPSLEPWPAGPLHPSRFVGPLTDVDGAVIEYVLHRTATYAFVLTEHGLAARVFDPARRDLDGQVAALVGPFLERGGTPPEITSFTPDSTGRSRLYLGIFTALEGYLGHRGPLFIVPDGSLTFCPFGMLLRPRRRSLSEAERQESRKHLLGHWEGEHVILERYDFSYALSITGPAGLSRLRPSGDESPGPTDRPAGGSPARTVFWPRAGGSPEEVRGLLASWEQLRDFFVPDALWRHPYAMDAGEAETVRLAIENAVAAAPVFHAAVPSFSRETEPWRSFLVPGATADTTGTPAWRRDEAPADRAGHGAARSASPQPTISFADLALLSFDGGLLVLPSGFAINPLRPYVMNDLRFPWDDASARAGGSLVALRLAARRAGARALGVALWPAGEASPVFQVRFYGQIAAAPTGPADLVRAWGQAERDVRYLVLPADDPHHRVSLSHPYFWAGNLLTVWID